MSLNTTGDTFPFLSGGGEMAGLIRAFDWPATPPGPPAGWPQSLRVSVSNMLHNGLPMMVLWGPELICFYNDPVIPSLDPARHPAIGKPAMEVWPEAWETVGPMLEGVMRGGGPVLFQDVPVTSHRSDKSEQLFWTFCYSPILAEDGSTGGVLVTCIEGTPGVRARQQQEQSALSLRRIIMDAPVAMCIFRGADFVIEVANERMFQFWGKPADAVMGKPLFAALPEAAGQGYEELLRNVLETATPFTASELPVMLLRGGVAQPVHINFSYEPLREPDGAISGILAVATDVTGQVAARKQIEESEAHLRLLRNTVPAMIFYLDAEQRYRSYNETFMTWFGVGETEAIGKSVQEFLGPRAYEATRPHLSKAYAGEQVRYEMLAPSRMGDPRWLNITYTPHKGAGGKVAGLIVHAADITPTKQSEVALRESEAALRNAIELAELGTWVVEVATGNTALSQRHADMFGLDARELPYGQALAAVHPDDRERVAAAFEQAMMPGAGGRYEAEYRITHARTGKPRIIHAQGETIFDKDGKPLRITGTARDITMQRELQTALEAEVQARTEELQATVKELADSNAALVHSNEELAQYAYVASHDLQEPLRKIRVFTGMLGAAKELLPATRVTLAKITASAERMTLLIQDLLAFSRLLKSDTLMRPVSLPDTMRAVVGDFELIVQEKSARIDIGELPVIEAVSLQMNQLFYNLLSNSLKFTAAGVAPCIRVSSRSISQEEAGRYIRQPQPLRNYYEIIFADNGIGFETTYSEQIFEVFKRLQARDAYPGSGIGLALCRRIVSNHQGHLFADSVPGKGSRFHIILPDRQQEASSPASASGMAENPRPV